MFARRSVGTLLGVAFALSLASMAHADSPEADLNATARPDWAAIFTQTDAEGTIVVSDERSENKGVFVFEVDRAARRYSPASTFKIAHALFALDAGVIADEFQVIPWDGTKRSYDAWNRDQSLRSSMRHSVVWVYQHFAAEIGLERERQFMTSIQYGNCEASGPAPFWVEGNLRISAHEQISFLRRLYQNKLPFQERHQRLVKDLMIVEAGRDWILRAKTGWSGTVGWWVGWVEWSTGPVFFALNIDTPNRMDDLPKREGITREILLSINALPEAVDD